MMEILVVVVSAVVGGSVVKTLDWVLTRRENKKKARAEADQAEVRAEADEFHHLREMVEWMQASLKEKEERFADQTQLVRRIQRELLEAEKKVAKLETERSMKLCEVRNCGKREPQSGY